MHFPGQTVFWNHTKCQSKHQPQPLFLPVLENFPSALWAALGLSALTLASAQTGVWRRCSGWRWCRPGTASEQSHPRWGNGWTPWSHRSACHWLVSHRCHLVQPTKKKKKRFKKIQPVDLWSFLLFTCSHSKLIKQHLEATHNPFGAVLNLTRAFSVSISNSRCWNSLLYLGVFHQHVFPRNSEVVHFQVAIIHFIIAKFGANVTHCNTCHRQSHLH